MARAISTSRISAVLAAALLGAALTGCAARVDTRGNLPDPELLAEIQPGQISRMEVEEILGSPSSVATFDQESWYYISERTETTAFLAPQVAERNVVVIRFDQQGVVSAVEKLGIEDGRVIRPSDRETPTAGNEIGFLQQIFGNLGKFGTGEK